MHFLHFFLFFIQYIEYCVCIYSMMYPTSPASRAPLLSKNETAKSTWGSQTVTLDDTFYYISFITVDMSQAVGSILLTSFCCKHSPEHQMCIKNSLHKIHFLLVFEQQHYCYQLSRDINEAPEWNELWTYIAEGTNGFGTERSIEGRTQTFPIFVFFHGICWWSVNRWVVSIHNRFISTCPPLNLGCVLLDTFQHILICSTCRQEACASLWSCAVSRSAPTGRRLLRLRRRFSSVAWTCACVTECEYARVRLCVCVPKDTVFVVLLCCLCAV